MSEMLTDNTHNHEISPEVNPERGKIPEDISENNSVLSEEEERTSGCSIDIPIKVEIVPTIKVEKEKLFRIAGISPQRPDIAPGGEREFLEPLGLQYVLTQAANEGYEVDLFTLLGQSEDELVGKVIATKPEVVAISAMTPQMGIGLSMAGKIKEKSPSTKIIFGGYHPSVIHTSTPALITDSPVDYWVRGEGEKTFSELLRVIEQGKDPSDVSGLVYRHQGETQVTPARKRTQNLDDFGRVWRPDFIRNLRNRGLTYPAPSEQNGFASIDFSRGCLGDCDFCASPEVLGQAVSFRSSESVADEVRFLHDQMGVDTFFFTDLDFIQRGKNQEKTLELCRKLQQLEEPVYWECLGRIPSISETGNYQLLQEMYKAGCRKIAWGLESIDPEILESMKKGRKDDETMRVLSVAEDAGILNTAFYIIGWHNFFENIGDNKAKILRDAQSLPHYPIHRLRITIGTPLPGSQFYKTCKERGLLTDQELAHYDTEHLVYKHPSLEPKDISALRSEVYRQFYGSQAYKERVSRMVSRHPEYKKTFDEFLSELRF